MRKALPYILSLLVLVHSVACAETVCRRWGKAPGAPTGKLAGAKVPEGYVVKTDAAPTIDGKLEEAAWKKAIPLGLVMSLDGSGKASQPATAFVLRDAEKLYVAYRLVEPNMAKLQGKPRGHDSGVWGDDSVEFFIGPKGKSYYHFGVSAFGTTYDGQGKGSGWNSGFKAAVFKGKGFWSLETSIPLKPMVGDGPVPEKWIANFNRNRYGGGRCKESAWSSIFSGNSHESSRYGDLLFRDPPAQKAGKLAKQVEFLPAEGGKGIVHFDLTSIPKGTKIHRADLWIHRTVELSAADDEARVETEIFPLLGEAKAGAKHDPAVKPLAIRGPRFDHLDATEAVKAWVYGKPNGGFFVKSCPAWNKKGTCLDVLLEGTIEKAPPKVEGLKAFHRAGQTFLTWKEIDEPVGNDQPSWAELRKLIGKLDAKREVRYVVFRHTQTITSANLGDAERVARVKPLSCWNLNGRGADKAIDHQLEHRYTLQHGHWNPFCRASTEGEFGKTCPMGRLVIQDGGKPLPRGTGLYVHTTEKAGRFHYAVLISIDGVMSAGSLATVGGSLQETPQSPEPVYQGDLPPQPFWNYRAKRMHFVRWTAPPFANLPGRCYNWAVALPKQVTEGKAARASLPLELHLHTDGRSYYRTQYCIEKNSVVLLPHDFPMKTHWFGYHESLGTLKSLNQGAVHNYTERRLMWFMDWAMKKWPCIDSNRVIATATKRRSGGPGPSGSGYSMSGALLLALRNPERFNLVAVGDLGDPLPKTFGGRPLNDLERAIGRRDWNLKTAEGKGAWDELDVIARIDAMPKGIDLPMVAVHHGRYNDGANALFGRLLNNGHPVISRSGSKFMPASATGTWPSTVRVDVSRNRVLPVFNQAKVSWKGTNLGFRWHSFDSLDQSDRAEATIRYSGSSPGRGSITLRRLQKFSVKKGQSYHWELKSLAEKDKVLQSGEATAAADGALVIAGISVPNQAARLIVTEAK